MICYDFETRANRLTVSIARFLTDIKIFDRNIYNMIIRITLI
jgi:hypothetical protein